MMTGTSYPAVAGPVAVISPQFCVGYPVDLTIVRKLMTLSEGSFGVTDVNGNIMFRVKGKLFSLHDRRVLLDATGIPIITFQQKLLSAHRRWQVFQGREHRCKGSTFQCEEIFTDSAEDKMHRKHSAQSILLGKDTFGVTVYPNVDYAFIVALVVILEEINEDRSGSD
ncbi:UNVERIFIED_CONTAM: protein LURP-one-related 15 [Sesamum angustifolium]|uniref:Protein LURP-one-related 15 n=1 Tax=Sesamum angustifolium TaxID=2727405 RepID=A0AAW2N3P7_9LAMI